LPDACCGGLGRRQSFSVEPMLLLLLLLLLLLR
jgi:hypothetical protein